MTPVTGACPDHVLRWRVGQQRSETQDSRGDGANAHPNGNGVSLKGGLTGATIGGTTGLIPNGACNIIANSTSVGVSVESSIGITIRGNRIEDNPSGGIVLTDGANGAIAAPAIDSPTGGSPNHRLVVNATGVSGTIDVYKTDGTTPARGRTYLMSHATSVPAANIDLAGFVTSGDQVMVTITSASGNTAKLSDPASAP